MRARLWIAIGVVLLLFPASAFAQKSTSTMAVLAWDSNPPEQGVLGYRAMYGKTAGVWDATVDVGNATQWSFSGLTPRTPYVFGVLAYNANDVSPTAVITWTTPDAACDYPLGNRSVTIFITPPLLKTGNGGAGTDARIAFRVLSPNSPVMHIGVLANGVERPNPLKATGQGDDVSSNGAMWFQMPTTPGTYALSLTATNAYGCTREQGTPFVLVVP